MLHGQSNGWYDVAQVCLNGHTVNDVMMFAPQQNQDFCTRCGEQTVSQCGHCNAHIRGEYHVSGVIGFSSFKLPRFCHACGTAYPWMKKGLDAAHALADELDELSREEREALKGTLDELARPNPNTEVAVVRTKKVLKKLGKEAGEGLRKVLVDIASEAAKKSMGL